MAKAKTRSVASKVGKTRRLMVAARFHGATVRERRLTQGFSRSTAYRSGKKAQRQYFTAGAAKLRAGRRKTPAQIAAAKANLSKGRKRRR